jgi:hypothetical protein
MKEMLGSHDYDYEIQCNCHGMGVVYNKNFIMVTVIIGTVNVVKVTDLETHSIKSEHFPGVFSTSDSKTAVTFSCNCTCTFASQTIYSK